MTPIRSTLIALALATAGVSTLPVVVEGVDVKVEHDKSFDFGPVRTWGWNPDGMGDVKMARTQEDDPDAMKRWAEPLIREAVVKEMTRRGLTESSTAPDVTVTYFLLLTTNMSTQTMGQFLPATAAWGLPYFAAATQSLEMMNRGSLVLDLRAGGNIVWRGVAQAEVEMGSDKKKREARLQEGVRDLLKRYPPKK